MFDRIIIGCGAPAHVSSRVTIEEKRAPTTESARLLDELQKEYRRKKMEWM